MTGLRTDIPPDRAAATLAAEIETVFDEVPRLLFDLLDRTARTADALKAIARACGPEGQADLARLADSAGDAAAAVAAELGALSDTAAGMRRRSDEMNAVLQRIRRDARMTRMIAVNAQIVSRSLPTSDGSLEYFANGTRSLLDEIEAAQDSLGQALRHADTRMERTGPNLDACVAALAGLGALHRSLPATVRSAFADANLARMAEAAGGRVAALNDRLGQAVGRLQIGDAVRQRLEHAVTIAGLARSAAPRDRQALHQLCAVQTDAALSDLQEALSDLLPRLAQMLSEVETSATELARIGQRDGTIAKGLSRGPDPEDLVARAEALRRGMVEAASTYGAADAAAAQIADADGAIHLLGLNATLVSGRLGTAGDPMAEVSKQLRTCTARIGEETRRLIALTTAQISDAERLEQDGTRHGAGETLGPLLTLDTRLRELLDNVAKLGRDSGEASVDLVRRAEAALRRFQRRATEMRPAPAGDVASPLPLSAELAQRVRALYSMEEERRLHDRLLGTAPGSEADHAVRNVFF
ncbi:hypothetical protein [Tranquillimonas rosea]|uniref:hypothetical protein n=1 Tax=Tranquillimonas rosea TaxID=641238 RepID=UPI003BAD0215